MCGIVIVYIGNYCFKQNSSRLLILSISCIAFRILLETGVLFHQCLQAFDVFGFKTHHFIALEKSEDLPADDSFMKTACCLDDGGCADDDLAVACLQSGGTFQGNLSVCGDDGCRACCNADSGRCTNATESYCTDSLGGTYLVDSDCRTSKPCVGACCVGGRCKFATEADCAAAEDKRM